MATIHVLPVLTSDFWSILPKHRLEVDRLMHEGKIISYAIAEDRSMVWMIVAAGDDVEAGAIVDSLPLRRFIQVHRQELAFHDHLQLMRPQFSLN